MSFDDMPDFDSVTTEEQRALKDVALRLTEAIDALTPKRRRRRAQNADDTTPEVTHGPDLVGLNLRHCIADLVREPALITRVRKVVCDVDPATVELDGQGREVLEMLSDRLYFPPSEGRQHHMPSGNIGHGGLPSRWWITNLDYRNALVAKLRALAAQLRGRGIDGG